VDGEGKGGKKKTNREWHVNEIISYLENDSVGWINEDRSWPGESATLGILKFRYTGYF
jgi:hypothetical protein